MKKYRLRFTRTDVTHSDFEVEVPEGKTINDVIDHLLYDEDKIDDEASCCLGSWDLEAAEPVQAG